MTGFESLNIIDVNMTNKLESLETFESKEINRSMITPNILRGVPTTGWGRYATKLACEFLYSRIFKSKMVVGLFNH